MNISEIIEKLITDIRYTRWQEWLSVFTQVMSVWYAKKNNILVYPTGIVGVLLAAWLYFFIAQPPLYADAILNVYYLIMSIYGWYSWYQKKGEQLVYPISHTNKSELVIGISIFIISWIAIYILLIKITDSNTPILDSLVSSTAITAMWWMAKRKIENWLAWIISNIIAIPLNFYKGFILFTLMYILFLVLAWMGWREWSRKSNNYS
jgi:nicotinamide mononucleotide transporter